MALGIDVKSQSRNRRTGQELRLDETSGEWNDHNLKHKLRGLQCRLPRQCLMDYPLGIILSSRNLLEKLEEDEQFDFHKTAGQRSEP